MVPGQVFTINVKEAQSEIKFRGESDNIRIAPTSLNALQESSFNNEGEERFEQKRSEIIASRASYWNIFHIITILCASSLGLSPQLLIPRHHTIFYPQYWKEGLIIVFAVTLTSYVKHMLNCVVFTKDKSLIKLKLFLRIFICQFAPPVSIFFLSRYIWTSIAKFQHPMPLLGLLVMFGGWLSYMCCLRLGIMFPSEMRNNDELKKGIRSYLAYEIWWFIINIQKDVLSNAFKSIPSDFQIIFALLLPVAKEVNKRILSKLVFKMAGEKNEVVNILLVVDVNLHYAFFITIRLNGAETGTAFSMIAVEILLHLWMTYQIIRINLMTTTENGQNEATDKRKKNAVLKLLLAELVEGVVPLAYAIGFTMAYFGPNAELIGNVLCDIWTYEKVKDVARLYIFQILFFGVDLLSITLNTFILSKFGNVNLIQELCEVLKNYWKLLAIVMTQQIAHYFAFNDINVANDMTNEFAWITKEGRLEAINNSTYFSDEEKRILLSDQSNV